MLSPSDHKLKSLYDAKFDETLSFDSLDDSQLLKSRKLFVLDVNNFPLRTIQLNVNAVVGGLPFSTAFIQYIQSIQYAILSIIGNTPCYFVKPENLGVEYFVSKWPDNASLTSSQHSEIIDILSSFKLRPFDLFAEGIQFHRDGCIILRGYDNLNILELRNKCMNQINWLPRNQSSWSHIPLGRILGQLDMESYSRLVNYCKFSQSSFFLENIDKIKYVDEHSWYMEEKLIIEEFNLLS